MIHKSIERFLEGAIYKMDGVVIPKCEVKEQREVYRDCAILTFSLSHPLTVKQLMYALEGNHGLVLMYHHMRSKDTDFGHSLCFFQQPGTGEMFQLDCSTNSEGKITKVNIKIYSSLERMVAELRHQLDRVSKVSGQFAYQIKEHELVSNFL